MTLGKLRLFEKVVIGPKEDPLLIRYVLWRLPAIGMYLHNVIDPPAKPGGLARTAAKPSGRRAGLKLWTRRAN
jgi:hypothetical protein